MSGTNEMWSDPYSNSSAVAVYDRTDTFVGLRGKRGEVIELHYAQEIAETSGAALVGYQQAGAGAVARTAQSKMSDVVSVLDFGSDTEAVQSAINSLGGGGFVLVPRGVSYSFASLTIPENVTLFDEANSRIVFHDCALEDGNATNLLLRSPVAGTTRVHIEPRGWVDSGTASKLDLMHDPFRDDLGNYRMFNAYTITGDPHGTGEGAICAINAKSTGDFWGNWPSMNFGFQDLGSQAVCAKVWYGEHGAPQHYTPMRGAWRSGKIVAAGDYVTASNKIYQASSSGTCGATIPSHASGTVSDGAVDWLFVRAPSSSTIRATFMFGNRSQMPVLGYADARVQFGTHTVTHWGASHKYVTSSGVLIAETRAAGSTGSETFEVGVSGGGYTRWVPSGNFVQNVGIAKCAAVVSAADGATAPSVAGVETLSFANTSATTVTALSGGLGGQRVRLVSTNGNTTIAHTVATSGGVIRNATGANIVMKLDGALDLERHPSADFWRVVGVGF